MRSLQSRLLLPLTLLWLFAAPANALELGEAKARGLVGEMSTGYLGVVEGGAEAEQLVASVNAQRRTQYQHIARQNGTTLAAVEKIAAQKTLEMTPAGQYVHDGRWRKK